MAEQEADSGGVAVISLADRSASYSRAFPDWPAPRTDARWIDGMWILGNDYRNKSRLYGAFPPGLLARVFALFPDAERILHVFSGSLTREHVDEAWSKVNEGRPHQVRLDNGRMPEAQEALPNILVDAERVAECFPTMRFDLVIADPPYTTSDAERYGARLPNKKRIISEIAKVVRPGGSLVWLDTSLPMFRKSEWEWYGAFGIVRSTNHRARLLSIFRRADGR